MSANWPRKNAPIWHSLVLFWRMDGTGKWWHEHRYFPWRRWKPHSCRNMVSLYLDGEYFTDGPMTGNYDNVPGLAVERTVDSEEGSTVRLMLYGEHEGSDNQWIRWRTTWILVSRTKRTTEQRFCNPSEKPYNNSGKGLFKPEDDELCSAEMLFFLAYSQQRAIASTPIMTLLVRATSLLTDVNGMTWDGNGEWDEGENGIPNWKNSCGSKNLSRTRRRPMEYYVPAGYVSSNHFGDDDDDQ